jgi:hypothetical protein
MLQLNENEYAHYYKQYIDALVVDKKSIVFHLKDTLDDAIGILSNLSEDKQMYKYADDKWTIKELIQHIIDTERIFGYRALRFARNDATPLPGFEQNDYATIYNANKRVYKDLLEEFELIRKSIISLFKSFGDEELIRTGQAGGNNMSVRALGYIISGHLQHHLNIIKERYL